MTLNLTWGIAYGAWTMIQVCEIFYHPRLRDCKYNNHSLLELNYVVILLCGVFISLNLVCLLIYTLTTCQSICAADGDSQHSRFVNTFIRVLLRVNSNNDQIFFKEQNSCMLCSRNFTMDCMVIPVPCPNRHYFHAQCIEEWMQETPRPACPICHAEINPTEIDEITKVYRKTLLAHIECCYNSSTSGDKV